VAVRDGLGQARQGVPGGGGAQPRDVSRATRPGDDQQARVLVQQCGEPGEGAVLLVGCVQGMAR